MLKRTITKYVQWRKLDKEQIESFVKDSLEARFGIAYDDVANDRLLFFADNEAKNKYIADNERFDLVLFTYTKGLSTKADSADIIELEQILALVAIDTEARLSAIEERLNGNMGSISVDTIDVLRAINLHSANGNIFTEGTSAPSAAPDAPLLVYYNKTSGKVYLSVGTTSSSMWIMLN